MASETAIVALVDQVHDACGRIDLLVNNACAQNRNYLTDITGDFWGSVLDVNLRGPAIVIRKVVKRMHTGGIDGQTVNIASNSAFHATTHSLYAYSTSKAAMAGLTRTAAIEVVKDDIRANAICSGTTATPCQTTSTGPKFHPRGHRQDRAADRLARSARRSSSMADG